MLNADATGDTKSAEKWRKVCINLCNNEFCYYFCTIILFLFCSVWILCFFFSFHAVKLAHATLVMAYAWCAGME